MVNNHTKKSTALDRIDTQILVALDREARIAITDLAKEVNLSPPSVADRIRRLEDNGIIRGFSLELDERALGYQIAALVRIRPLPGKLHLVERMLQDNPQIVECDKITGDDAFLARLLVHDVDDLHAALYHLNDYAVTSTAIIGGKSVARRLPPLADPASPPAKTGRRPRSARSGK